MNLMLAMKSVVSSRNPLLLFWAVTFLLCADSSPLTGGIYTPDEPCYFEEFDAEWNPRPIAYANFKLLLSEMLAIDPREDRGESRIRKLTLERVETRRKIPPEKLTDLEIAGLSGDLIRLGREHVDEALNFLRPLAGDRQRANFFVLSHLARVHQERLEWETAYRKQSAALTDYRFPSSFPGYLGEQLNWYRRLERRFDVPLLRSRWLESEQNRAVVHESIDPIFPIRLSGVEWLPIQYIGESGEFTAGNMAKKEMEKLPPDAIAILQQLVLWNPHDPRLYWQLGELYNACGEVKVALEIFDECVNSPRNYSNRQLMEHRQILREYQDRLLDEERTKQETEERKTRVRYYVVGGIVGGLVLLLGLLQLREIVRRRSRSRGVR